jgi:glycosyltransferase involved in cell wall biosynthesis
MSDPLVSVVIPAFNRERFVAEALESVVAQEYRPIEVIVVDDGSTDATAEVAGTFSDVVVIRQENRGPGAARNTGLARATGSFITFMDSDDVMSPRRLVAQVEHLRTHPNVECVLMKQEVLLDDGAPMPDWLRPRHQAEVTLEDHLMTAMIRRSVLERVGGFDPRPGEDLDWFIRLHEARVVVDVLPHVGVLRRVHDANYSHQAGVVGPPLMRAVREHIERVRTRDEGTR